MRRRWWHSTPVLLPGKSHGWRSLVGCSRTWLSNFTFSFHFHALEKEMAIHSSILAWRIPWTEEVARLQSTGFFFYCLFNCLFILLICISKFSYKQFKGHHTVKLYSNKLLLQFLWMAAFRDVSWTSCMDLYSMTAAAAAREGHGIPLQYSCLENPMEGGAW